MTVTSSLASFGRDRLTFYKRNNPSLRFVARAFVACMKRNPDAVCVIERACLCLREPNNGCYLLTYDTNPTFDGSCK